MKVLLVTSEFFEWGLYGGFGAFARKLGVELIKRGIEVDAVIPRLSPKQGPHGSIEVIDGIKIKNVQMNILRTFYKKMYKTDANIIHAQCSPLDTALAFKFNPKTPKVVTFQDLRTKEEMQLLAGLQGEWNPQRGIKNRLENAYIEFLYKRALKRADIFSQAEMLKPKIKMLYGIDPQEIGTLPNFVDIPSTLSACKSDTPSVLWLGRLDDVKRFDWCIETARLVPEADFYVLGRSHDEAKDHEYRSMIENQQEKGRLLNVHMLGFMSGEEKTKMLSKAWILINTSIYECLPVSFLEAFSYKCSILSTRDPDGLTSRFGYSGRDPKDLSNGLRWLIKDDRWRELGEAAYEHVKKKHETSECVDKHIEIYRSLVK